MIDGSSTPPTKKIKKITIIDGKEGFIIPEKLGNSYVPDEQIYNNERAFSENRPTVTPIKNKEKGKR